MENIFKKLEQASRTNNCHIKMDVINILSLLDMGEGGRREGGQKSGRKKGERGR